MCGKNIGNRETILAILGSPPRVREKPRAKIVCSCVSRITPACAGKTMKIEEDEHIIRDHPRVCGKNTLGLPDQFRRLGSPPRVREKLWSY